MPSTRYLSKRYLTLECALFQTLPRYVQFFGVELVGSCRCTRKDTQRASATCIIPQDHRTRVLACILNSVEVVVVVLGKDEVFFQNETLPLPSHCTGFSSGKFTSVTFRGERAGNIFVWTT